MIILVFVVPEEGGTLHMKGVGMLLEIETHLGVAQAFADP